MRIAEFNVNNLFERPKAMNFPTHKEGQPTLDDANELNSIINKQTYSAQDKKRMLTLLKRNKLLSTRPKSELLEFRKIKGQLFRCPKNGSPEIVANGREDWVGWVDLKKEAIDDESIVNTAKVIVEVDPDVLVIVEAETRYAISDFHDEFMKPLLKAEGKREYPFNMLIDGNDRRGIDVGILSRYPIKGMRSHIFDEKDGKRVFSRDCAEFILDLGNGRELLVMSNHFASKGSDTTGTRRRLQSGRVKEIYDELKAKYKYAVIAGDFNDYPDSGNLDALLKQTDLTDVMALSMYNGYPGTYETANDKQKFDYILLSPELTSRVTAVDVCRKGTYAPRKWDCYDNITKDTKDRLAASDHQCVWADITW